jgi:hypothetical protein
MADPYTEMKVDDPAIAADRLFAGYTADPILLNAVANETTGVRKSTRSLIKRALAYAQGDGLMRLNRALVAQRRQFDVDSADEFKARLKQAGATDQVCWGVLNA